MVDDDRLPAAPGHVDRAPGDSVGDDVLRVVREDAASASATTLLIHSRSSSSSSRPSGSRCSESVDYLLVGAITRVFVVVARSGSTRRPPQSTPRSSNARRSRSACGSAPTTAPSQAALSSATTPAATFAAPPGTCVRPGPRRPGRGPPARCAVRDPRRTRRASRPRSSRRANPQAGRPAPRWTRSRGHAGRRSDQADDLVPVARTWSAAKSTGHRPAGRIVVHPRPCTASTSAILSPTLNDCARSSPSSLVASRSAKTALARARPMPSRRSPAASGARALSSRPPGPAGTARSSRRTFDNCTLGEFLADFVGDLRLTVGLQPGQRSLWGRLVEDDHAVDRVKRGDASARCPTGTSGLPSPFSWRTEASPLTPTTRTSLSPRAASKLRT